MPDLTFPSGDKQLAAYVAVPEGPGPWPGVVMLQDALGMTADLRKHADHMAAGGFLVIAPDLYSGGNKIACIQATVRSLALGKGPAFGHIEAARQYLIGRSDCTGKVGITGFCMGGQFALLVASTGFDAAAPNYGLPYRGLGEALSDPCPVVGSYGGRDPSIPVPMVRRLERRLDEMGVPNDIKIYPKASHSFFQDYTGAVGVVMKVTGMTYKPAACSDSWDRIFAFFGEHLATASTASADPIPGS